MYWRIRLGYDRLDTLACDERNDKISDFRTQLSNANHTTVTFWPTQILSLVKLFLGVHLDSLRRPFIARIL
jgi:hypothetical protein